MVFFFQAEDGIRYWSVTGVQTCALPILIAPGTDRAGAVLLAERLARGVKTLAGATPGLRAGYDAVGNARYTPIEPKNLLSRATTALRAAKGQGGPNWIQGFNS